MNLRTAAQPDSATARSYWTMGRGDAERAFRDARRHSRYVRLLRTLVPAVVVAILGGLLLWKFLNPVLLVTNIPDNPADLVVSGSKITMELPRLTGYTRDSRSYELTAAKASQDIARPDIVEMSDIHAKLQMLDKSSAELTARSGVYDSKKEVLKLGQQIVMTSSTGYRAWLNDAVINVKTSDLVTERPVEVQLLQGTLNANRLEVKESGNLLIFDGGVKMKLQPQNAPAGRAGAQ